MTSKQVGYSHHFSPGKRPWDESLRILDLLEKLGTTERGVWCRTTWSDDPSPFPNPGQGTFAKYYTPTGKSGDWRVEVQFDDARPGEVTVTTDPVTLDRLQKIMYH